VRRAKNILNLAVIFGFLIGIHNQQSNGSPRGFTLKDPRQNLNFIRFFSLRREPRSAGLSAIKVGLKVRSTQRQSRRASINNAPEPLSMTLTESRNGE
jgi:hypothetical protein